MTKKIKLTTNQRIKKNIWRRIYPVFPWLQSHLLKWHLVWHEKGRQPYHLGWLAPGKTLQDLENHLHNEWNFGNHFVAWTDKGQVLSWRKLVDFDNQYHIRVFKDGEIRGHFEYTPESKPLDHFIEINEQARIDEFKKFLGHYVVQKKYISHLKKDTRTAPDSEITIDESLILDK
ncbi:MAG: hypothetical protein KGI58_02570 [Patescibacteria group bacterium]|nr:hypothetical protein [Patescibacteria group bacterium]